MAFNPNDFMIERTLYLPTTNPSLRSFFTISRLPKLPRLSLNNVLIRQYKFKVVAEITVHPENRYLNGFSDIISLKMAS